VFSLVLMMNMMDC